MDNQPSDNDNPSGMQATRRSLGDHLHGTVNDWQQQYAQSNTANIPHDDVAAAFNQWSAQATPTQQQAAIEHAFNQASVSQRSSIGNTLINLLTQRGLNPQDAGVQTTNPNQMNPQDLARLTTYAQQQDPNIIRQLLSNPLVGMIISAALSYALQRFLGGTQNYSQPLPQTPQTGGGGLGDLFGQLFGGNQSQPTTPTIPYPTQPTAPQGGGGIGDLIGQFLGGGESQPTQPTAPQGGGGIGDLIGQFLGGGDDPTTQTGQTPPNAGPNDNPLDVTKRRS